MTKTPINKKLITVETYLVTLLIISSVLIFTTKNELLANIITSIGALPILTLIIMEFIRSLKLK